MEESVEGAPTLREAVARYLDDLALEGRPAGTRRTWRAMLAVIRDDDRSLAVLTEPVCRQLLTDRIQHQSNGTARLMHAVLKGFCAYCVSRHWFVVSPMDQVPAPRTRRKRQPTLTRAQLQAVREIACQTPEGELIFRLLLEGLRAAELLAIRWTDIRPDRIQIVGKGDRPR